MGYRLYLNSVFILVKGSTDKSFNSTVGRSYISMYCVVGTNKKEKQLADLSNNILF